MAMKANSSRGGAIRRVLANGRALAAYLVYERTLLLLTVIVCVGGAATLWHLSHLSRKLVESGALQGTSIYSESITDLRTFYNSEVVERVRPNGVEVTHDYSAKKGAIPIPATFTIEFGKRIGEKNSGMQIRLYSDYPFPFRKDGGPHDEFEAEALRQLRAHPDRPFTRFESVQGRPSLRYATAVQMKAGCVACHNSHPESPKIDWKVGDVRGVQEIIQTLDNSVAQTRSGLRDTFVLLSAMGLLGLGGLGLVIGRMRQTSVELKQRVLERTAAEARLAALHEINVASTSTLDLKSVLDILLEKTDRVLPFIAATTVRLFNKQTGELEPVACRNLDEDQWKAETTKGDAGLARLLPEGNTPLMVLNAQTDPRSLATAFLHRYGLVSFLRVPLLAKSQILGVVTFFTKEEHRFSNEEVEFLSALSGQAAIAIHNARLYEETTAAKGELEKANGALKKQAVELARSNAELEQFAYVASHDLQEPLRMVASYTQLLAKRYKGKLDTDADEFISYAVEGVTRMQSLILDLLSYSKLGKKEKDLEPTECSTLLTQALANLKGGIDDSGATVSSDPLPAVMADSSQLVQLFQNLIGNAIKFRNQKAPLVHVSARREGKDWLFSIADNGIGFDPQFAERIFVIFQRLHAKTDYPGTGIGLAVCKKIVERHGGRIWAKAEPGKGATFHFTIPA
ncbi:MAG TPA: ATP-binding protein [Candidatus Binatia bacterium]|jgi:signal transduction histidine kinase